MSTMRFLMVAFLAFASSSTSADHHAMAGPMVPDAVKPPSGERVAWWTVGSGRITYECRPKMEQFEWAFVAPAATLTDKAGKVIGKYYSGPTWEAGDGSKITGKQVATAPGGAGNIPLQLVKAEPAMGKGVLEGVTHIQRVNTKGGVAPPEVCGSDNVGSQRQVTYEAEYVFYKKS